MSDTPGGQGVTPVQTVTLPAQPSRTTPSGDLADMSAAELWLGLRSLVGTEAACEMFDIAARMVCPKSKALALN